MLFHMFVYQPISDIREELAQEEKKLGEAREKHAEATKLIEGIFYINPRLTQWQKISLPPRDPSTKPRAGVSVEEQQKKHIRDLQSLYEQYLSKLLQDNHFSRDTKVTIRQADKRAPLLKGKEPVYDKLAFSVVGRADVENVMKTLKKFYQTNLLHNIRSLTLTEAQRQVGSTPLVPGTLDVTMQVEALIVNGAEERIALMPEKLAYPLKVLAEPERRYDMLVKRNMFTGVLTADQSEGSDPVEDPGFLAVDPGDRKLLQFVKLTMLCYDSDKRRWEATLYNQAKGGDETSVDQRIWNTFKITGQGEQVLLAGKVVLIDEKQLIFKEDKQKDDKKFYRLHCGDFLGQAISKPLSATETKTLGLTR